MLQRLRTLSPALATLCECSVNARVIATTSPVDVSTGGAQIDKVDQDDGASTMGCCRGSTRAGVSNHVGIPPRNAPRFSWAGSHGRGFHSSSLLSSRRRGGVGYGSDSDDSDFDDSPSDDDLDLDEEEDSVWEQYREVDEEADDDQDDIEPTLNPKRRLIQLADDDEDVDREGRDDDELDRGAPDDQEDGMAGQLKKLYDPGADVASRFLILRVMQELDVHARKLLEVAQQTKSKEFKKMTRKQREDFIQRAAISNPPPGIDPPAMVNPGLKQLEKLLGNGRWCTTFVDVKLTTKQTPQGKKQRYSVMVMVGDLNGTGGYGVGVAKEPNEATLKALRIALLNAVVIPRYRQRTVYFPHHTKFVKTEMSIFPRPLEFGLVAPPVLVEACELLGLHDLTVKTHKSRNTRNVVKCFFKALCNIPTPQEIAEAKGCYIREKLGRKIRAPRITDGDLL